MISLFAGWIKYQKFVILTLASYSLGITCTELNPTVS